MKNLLLPSGLKTINELQKEYGQPTFEEKIAQIKRDKQKITELLNSEKPTFINSFFTVLTARISNSDILV